MNDLNIWEFDHPDIQRLAIHIREAASLPRGIVPIEVNVAVGASQTIVGGGGLLVAVSVLNTTATAGVLALTDGPVAEQRFIALEAVAVSGVFSGNFTNDGLPFRDDLVISDQLGVTGFVGQVFVRPRARK